MRLRDRRRPARASRRIAFEGRAVAGSSLEILIERWVKKLLRLGRVEVPGRNQGHAGIDALLDRLAAQVIEQRLHAQLAHAKWILHDDAVELSGAHGLHEDLAGVEADEADLPGATRVFEREQRAGGR